MLSWIPKGWAIWRAAQRLRGATSSATTRAQWKGPGWLVMAPVVAVAVAGQVWPDSPLGVVGIQEGLVAVLLWALSPLAARVAGKVETSLDVPEADGHPSSPTPEASGPSVLDRSSLWVRQVKRYSHSGWTGWNGTALDALYEGWDLGATAGGEIWDLHEFRPTGEMARDEEQRMRALAKVREGLEKIERGEGG